MAKNRAAVEKWVYRVLNELDPSGTNTALYRNNIFGKMSDKDFDQYIQDLKSKKRHSVIYAPNHGKVRLDHERNYALAEKLGFSFFERVWIEGKPNQPAYLTPVKYLILPTRIRRQAQLVMKGASVPKNMRTINVLTGQPTGESKAAKISLPELQLCAASGMVKSMEELMSTRGGDVRAGAALQAMLVRHGSASLNSVKPFSSGVESTNYISALFTAAMMKINL